MKLRILILAGTLASFSGIAGGFDFGKLLEDQLKRQTTQPAPSQPAPAQPAPTAQPAQATQPEKPKFDPFQLGAALLRGYSVEEEMRIGQQIAGNLLGAAPLVKDDALQQYVNQVGRWVALQSGRDDVPWRFAVIESDAINAFAAPGGYVFVTKGLYRRLDSEAQLAGVLAHEIAHVTQKHYLKLLKQSSVIGALGQAAAAKANTSDPLVQNLIGNGAEIMARGLDRDTEFEADRLGVVYAARAGYTPWGLPDVLQDLATLPNDSRTGLLFKTHPHPADRLAALGEAVGDRFDAVGGKALPERFYRIR
jgi:predicted Zn-dependent protease